MIAEAADFAAECEATYNLLKPLDDADYNRETQFKGWLINDIMQHLYSGDMRAHMTLTDPEGYARVKAARQTVVATTTAEKLANQRASVGHIEGRALLEAWRESAAKTAAAYAEADPKQRVEWVGPDMSARSSITARLMETWSHSQALYDILGKERADGDRIRAIAHLGAITYGWTFANRGEKPPGPAPLIRLTAPSGAIWEWNADSAPAGEAVEGPATDFCQVVAQTRSIADVNLSVTGKCATAWMNQAQCFAGPPNDPPAPGSRFKQMG
jgi:uncharacterized protein (TIGR03084 family)